LMLRACPTVFRAFLAAALLALPASARADDFYKGKTVTLVVGLTAGGGYDLYARALARFIPEHIPGHPTVIVQNMPGAGSLVALRALNATQPKDGTVMLTFEPGLITQSIVQPESVNVDFSKLAWIGVTTPTFQMCYGFGPNGVKTWDDMMHRKEFVVGAVAKGGSDYIKGAILREVFGAPVKQVLGFPGSADEVLALERGELDGECGSLSSVPADWLRNDKAHLFVRFTAERPPEMPETALPIDDFATTQDQKDLLDVLDAEGEIGRAYVMSADVPADRIAVLRQAFNDTMKDPAFLADMEKAQFPVHPLTGEEAGKIVAKIGAVSPAIIAKAKKIYE
jgi:tripartite-type tricarboxylate transporter receptor subunit TctC